MRKNWTEYEIEYLRNHYYSDGAVACAEALGRPVRSLRNKAFKMNISGRIAGKEYSQTELSYLRNHFGIDDLRDIARTLGRSYQSVKNKCSEIGLRRYFEWTPEKVAILREKYHDHLVVDLMEELGAEYRTIIKKAHAMRLKKDPDFFENNRDRICKRQSAAQIAKGGNRIRNYRQWLADHPEVTPIWEHNRGRKRSPEAIEKMKQTMRKTFEAERRRLRWGLAPKLKRKLKI